MLTPKILVVEDFERFRQFVVSTLRQRADFQIAEASTGLEALQKAEEQRPDLTLLDIGLPDLNGIEVARRLLRLAVPPKIIFVSQESSPEIVGEALDLALGYVHKSRAASDLKSAVGAVLEGKQFRSRNLKVPLFDIFSGVPDKNAVWIETVAGLSNARARMEAIAAQEPGHYFVFSPRDHTILAKTETQTKQEQERRPDSKSDVA